MKKWFRQIPQALAQSGKRHKELKYPILLLLFLISAVCQGIDAVGALTRPAIRRRVLAAAISVCMVVTMLPMQAFATKPAQNVGSLCEHHTEHTPECGYTEGTAGTPCTHEHKVNDGEADREGGLGHTEDCYQEVTDCIHKHTADCFNDDAEIATDSGAKEPVNCGHICGEDTGCITQELDCTHVSGEHDDTCGSIAGTQGTPCTYLCEICYPAENDTAIQPMKANVLSTTRSGKDWELDDTGELTISTAAGMTDWVDKGLEANLTKVITVTIADAVTDIPEKAFWGCTNLERVTADKAATINTSAFNGCKALTDASFPAVTTIGDFAFENCAALTDASFPVVKTIGKMAFYYCTALESASFPVAETIGEGAFYSCSKFAALSLGAAPPEVKDEAFYRCRDDRTLNLVDANGTLLTGEELTKAKNEYKGVDDGDTTDSRWYDWIIVDKGWKIDADGNLNISTADGMTDWREWGLTGNETKVTTVTIDAAVTEILPRAFRDCTALTKVTANSVTNIGESAFKGCTALESASFPAATNIGDTAFSGCNVLKSASFPVATRIGNDAFFSCSKLDTFTLGATPPKTGNSTIFKDCPDVRKLNLVDANGEPLTGDALTAVQKLYKQAFDYDYNDDDFWYGWKIGYLSWDLDAAGNLTIFNTAGMTHWVNKGLTANKDNVKTVTIEPSVTEIPKEAFKECSVLESASFSGVEIIGESAFESCKNLKSVTAPAVKTISKGAFYLCAVLESANFPAAESIGKYAFANCAALESASFPVAEIIDRSGLSDCASLTNVTAPAVKTINKDAFSGCAALKSANFPVATTIGESAFYNCKSLTNVTAPAVKTIGEYAFNCCFALTSVSFPAATTIGKDVFYCCNELTSASFPAAEIISEFAFYGCKKLATLSLPAAPPSVADEDAFLWCPLVRSLKLVNPDGSILTEGALVHAQENYKKDTFDRNSTDNFWCGWIIEDMTIASVEVTPNITNVQKGEIEQFIAKVTGTNNPPHDVTWKVTGGEEGTSISTGGLLTVASDETAESLTVTATSTADITKSGTATVIVTGNSVTKYTIILNANGGNVSPASATTGENGKLTSLPTPSRSGSYRFDGWFTAASGGTKVTTDTVFTSNNIIFAHWTYTGGGSSGGGSSSDDSDGGGSVTKPSTPDQSNPSMGETTVTAPVDGNGNASVTVTDKTISDAIKEAKKDAAQNQPISVSIKVETDKEATQITAALSKTVLETLINNKVDAVKITTGAVTMSFSQAAIQQITGQANADVTITAAKSDTSKLTGEAKALIGSRPMFDFNVAYGSGEKITDFGGDTVSIAIPYTFGNGEVPGNLCAVYVDGNGNATKITNSSYDADQQSVIFITNHFSQYGIGYQESHNFTDISNHWAKTNIEFVANRGLMSGTSNTTFAPNDSMTRGMFVTALGRLAGIDTSNYKTGKFTDVKTDAYYAPYVNWAADKGIVKGTSDTTFAPDQDISRQEMAVIMSNYASALGYQVPETRDAVTFADNASIESWAAAAVKQMQMAGILNGKNNNTFDPTGTATRGEISAMLHRYVEQVIDKSTSEGWTTNDSGSSMYYQNGKALVGAQTLGGVAYTFNSYGETTR